LLALILELDRREKFQHGPEVLRQIGRASLFIFIAQYALFNAVVPRLGIPYTPFWPVLFAACVMLLAGAAIIWNERDGKRLLTVGVGPLMRRYSTARTPPLVVLPKSEAKLALGGNRIHH